MSVPVGFVLITHNQPAQTAYVCKKLSEMFDSPPIAIHHDYSQSYLDPATLPPQVRIVQNWVKTSWGASSVVDAYLSAVRLLHATAAPEWTINMSSADYPVKTARVILQTLQSSNMDAFLDYRDISHGLQQPADARSIAAAFLRPTYLRLARKRYLAFSVVHYRIRKLIGRADQAIYLNNAWSTRLFTPFSRSFKPYAGDWWGAFNRRAVDALLSSSKRSQSLRRFYQKRELVEESYMHTVLLNTPGLRVENDNLRYAVWPEGAAHPKTLDVTDIRDMVASEAHFARKFPFDPELYAALDKAVEAAEYDLPEERV